MGGEPTVPVGLVIPPQENLADEGWSYRSLSARTSFAGLLVLAMAVGPMMQGAVAALAPLLVADLDLTRTELGGFTSVVFVAAAVAAPVSGRSVDRSGPQVALFVSFGSVVAAALVLASATSYVWVVLAAVLVGIPSSVANPATNQLVRSTLPHGERGLLMGVKQSGVKIGQLLAGLLLPTVAVLTTWRFAVLTVGAVALAALVLVSRSTFDRPDVSPRQFGSGSLSADLPLVVRLAIFAVLMGAGQSAANTYLPLFAFEDVGLSVTAGGLLAALAAGLGVVSRIGWAIPVERAKRASIPLLLVAAGSTLSGGLFLLSSLSGLASLVVATVVYGATASVWNVIAMLVIVRRTAEHATGRATSLIFLGFSLGFVVGPPMFGALVDATGDYTAGWSFVCVAFVAAFAVALEFTRWETRRAGWLVSG